MGRFCLASEAQMGIDPKRLAAGWKAKKPAIPSMQHEPFVVALTEATIAQPGGCRGRRIFAVFDRGEWICGTSRISSGLNGVPSAALQKRTRQHPAQDRTNRMDLTAGIFHEAVANGVGDQFFKYDFKVVARSLFPVSVDRDAKIHHPAAASSMRVRACCSRPVQPAFHLSIRASRRPSRCPARIRHARRRPGPGTSLALAASGHDFACSAVVSMTSLTPTRAPYITFCFPCAIAPG